MNNLLSSFKTVAGVLKLVDKPDLGSGAERRMGSIPFARTQKENHDGSLFSYGRVPALPRYPIPKSLPSGKGLLISAQVPNMRSKGISDFSTPVTS